MAPTPLERRRGPRRAPQVSRIAATASSRKSTTGGTEAAVVPIGRRHRTVQRHRMARLEAEMIAAHQVLSLWKAGAIDLEAAASTAQLAVGHVVGDLCRSGAVS